LAVSISLGGSAPGRVTALADGDAQALQATQDLSEVTKLMAKLCKDVPQFNYPGKSVCNACE
jgi:hypothetical protein